ncbi:methyltransferase regulatory domain-containing protein [Caenispirillum bisanense]|uniref:SAM-dependent methyltransferase n=1 Tax=Caenispirillum bisanense TaxID=414052 RepID=A0A286GTC5_9PROT|nr:methyltransferase regulatory domain-containing protein [Caenispirillum bisanense]SOD98793.1 SAM-dependent methyltransferase [Caenispirillum bisanense]
MSDWTYGYVSDIDYTHGFYRELAPAHLRFCLLSKGIRPPEIDGDFTYCELGFGQGVTLNVMAAANPRAQVWGTDFNPNHAAGARQLSHDGGVANSHFCDDSFEEFLARDDLPQFDMIVLHGIYSWISAENRAVIAAFLRRRLKVGGAVYISYNTLPGWAPVMPLRELMIQHAAGGRDGAAQRVDRALAFAKSLADDNAAYFGANPGVAPRLEKMVSMSRNYLAHEYFNRDWTPLYHADVVRELSDAKLTFAATANVIDLIDAVALTAKAQERLAEVSDPVFRETLRDFIVNQQFRRDLFTRGAVRMNAYEQAERLRALRIALVVPRKTIPNQVAFPIGTSDLKAEVYAPLFDRLEKGPATIGEIAAGDPALAALPLAAMLQAVLVGVSQGWIAPCLDASGDGARRTSARRFNGAVLNRARTSADLTVLVSPVLGSGVPVDRITQLFLLARQEKQGDIAAFAWQILASQGQRLIREGATLESPEDNLAELRARAQTFTDGFLPVYEKLGLA